MYINTKISSLIDKYGLIDIEPILKNILNFNDLCIFGKAFIENKIYRHIEYYGMFGKSSDSNGHESESSNLIKLHQYGIFTTNGQINILTKDEEQRSYLSFYCENKVSNKIISLLLLDSRIYTIIYSFNNNSETNIIHNVPSKEIIENKINVTRYLDNDKIYNNQTNIWFDSHPLECYSYDEEDTNIYYDHILNSCLHICILCKEYGYKQDTTSILLEIIKECNIPEIIN